MSSDDFHIIENTSIDTSNIIRYYVKTYNQQGAQINHSDQGVDFLFGETNNYRQIGSGCLEFDITHRKSGGFLVIFMEIALSRNLSGWTILPLLMFSV